MYFLRVLEKSIPLSGPAVRIGRTADNDVVLEHPGVSSHHLSVLFEADKIWLDDPGSTNGTFVNGIRIRRREVVPGEEFRIASLAAVIEKKEVAASLQSREEIKKVVHAQLLERMKLKEVNLEKFKDEDLRTQAQELISGILNEMGRSLPPDLNAPMLIKDIVEESLGLGPLEDLLADPTVTEIMVNNARQIYIEQAGKIRLSEKCFSTNAQVQEVIQRIVAPLGRRIDESSPMVDARLKDGSRVNAIIPPLALRGPCLTIRKFSKKKLAPTDLLRFRSCTENMLRFMQFAVENRKNIVISGGTGSGKTTLLNILSSYIPSDERIVTLEDSAELQLPQEHVVSLESRPANIEGTGAVSIRDLVRNCLRMRPDRIVVGECRGGEALDMLQAMNTGHDGSLTTVHANTPRDALSRLETMCLMSGTELPLRAIRDQVSAAVELVVQQSRLSDGSRKITYISEIGEPEGDSVAVRDIFLFRQKGRDENGKVFGDFVPTGTIPLFVTRLAEQGVPLDLSLFKPAPGQVI